VKVGVHEKALVSLMVCDSEVREPSQVEAARAACAGLLVFETAQEICAGWGVESLSFGSLGSLYAQASLFAQAPLVVLASLSALLVQFSFEAALLCGSVPHPPEPAEAD
jgi:hypothetical protein